MNFMVLSAYCNPVKNKKALSATGLVAGAKANSGRECYRKYADKRMALRAFFGEIHAACYFGEQRVIAAHADVIPRVHARAALTHDDAARRNQLAAEGFDTQAF
jgi:hypothetical protein